MSDQPVDPLADRVSDAERRITEHPGYVAYVEWTSLDRMITAVFIPNWRELIDLLNEASGNPELAIELVQNVRPSQVRRQFQASTAQRLHNYVASTMTLVDHVRRIMDKRDDGIRDEFNVRKQRTIEHKEISFVQDLRNFTLHRTLPVLAHRFGMTGINSSEARMESEVQLSTSQLNLWDKWSSASRDFLADQGETVNLRPVVQIHGEIVLGLNSWLRDELALSNEPQLAEVNELVAARNAILTGRESGAGPQL